VWHAAGDQPRPNSPALVEGPRRGRRRETRAEPSESLGWRPQQPLQTGGCGRGEKLGHNAHNAARHCHATLWRRATATGIVSRLSSRAVHLSLLVAFATARVNEAVMRVREARRRQAVLAARDWSHCPVADTHPWGKIGRRRVGGRSTEWTRSTMTMVAVAPAIRHDLDGPSHRRARRLLLRASRAPLWHCWWVLTPHYIAPLATRAPSSLPVPPASPRPMRMTVGRDTHGGRIRPAVGGRGEGGIGVSRRELSSPTAVWGYRGRDNATAPDPPRLTGQQVWEQSPQQENKGTDLLFSAGFITDCQ